MSRVLLESPRIAQDQLGCDTHLSRSRLVASHSFDFYYALAVLSVDVVGRTLLFGRRHLPQDEFPNSLLTCGLAYHGHTRKCLPCVRRELASSLSVSRRGA